MHVADLFFFHAMYLQYAHSHYEYLTVHTMVADVVFFRDAQYRYPFYLHPLTL